MAEGIIYAIIAAFVFGLWTAFHQQASGSINYLFGAILVSLTAVIIGVILLLPKIKSVPLYSNPKGILFAVLAGVCALAIDFFALKAYGSGLSLSIGGPLIISGSVAVAALIGFFLGDAITLAKISGIVLIIIGSGILAVFSK